MKINMSVEAKGLKRKLNYLLNKGLTVDLSNEINDSAGHIVKDIKDRVGKKIDISGKPFEPLLPATIKQKKTDPDAVSRFADYPLIRTGAMTGALGFGGPYLKKRAKPTNQVAVISAPNKKAPYGVYHQTGGRSLPQREWFGISKDAEKNINKFVKTRIDRLLER